MPSCLFVASLGNPAPYHRTLHSAGHILLDALRQPLSLPPLARDSDIRPGLVSRSAAYTLYQCPSLMNVSGPAISKAWKYFVRSLGPDERPSAKLVILHDELESELGRVRVRTGGSARGHNGVKSVVQVLGQGCARIGVGIGRPLSRDSGVVAEYVLRQMTGREVEAVRGGAEQVAGILKGIRASS